MGRRRARGRRAARALVAVALTALVTPLASGSAARALPVGTTGVPDPSGLGPPGPRALAGFSLVYRTDFAGSALPPGWSVFTGVPGGDPGAQFGAAHVVVRGGVLHLNAWRDPAYGGKWVTGGLCSCGHPLRYGAVFVRSRLTGPGPNEVQLLWPMSDTWPPEIDFNESLGTVNQTSSTLHGIGNAMTMLRVHTDMAAWHTWGVIWTPGSVRYVLDGRVWGQITRPSAIPSVPMRLDLEQRAKCSMLVECPTRPVSMLVDWVAEYRVPGLG